MRRSFLQRKFVLLRVSFHVVIAPSLRCESTWDISAVRLYCRKMAALRSRSTPLCYVFPTARCLARVQCIAEVIRHPNRSLRAQKRVPVDWTIFSSTVIRGSTVRYHSSLLHSRTAIYGNRLRCYETCSDQPFCAVSNVFWHASTADSELLRIISLN